MKSVMISIKPKWCELIASGKKTIKVMTLVPLATTAILNPNENTIISGLTSPLAAR